jgi:phenylalanine-4-hydroxylase
MRQSPTSPQVVAERATRDYERRRREIGALLTTPGQNPYVEYLPYEHGVWRIVSAALAPLHRSVGCREFIDGVDALALGCDGIPQLDDVNEKLARLTGFRSQATPGTARPRAFYRVLAERRFLAAQFVRDADRPLFSSQPDVLHELIGHANALANPKIADIYEAAGKAFGQLTTDTSVDAFSRVFWFALEAGVVYEDGQVKAFGASVLSSVAELNQLEAVEIRAFTNLTELVEVPYNDGAIQPMLFAFRSFEHLECELLSFFDHCDEETMTRWTSSLTMPDRLSAPND